MTLRDSDSSSSSSLTSPLDLSPIRERVHTVSDNDITVLSWIYLNDVQALIREVDRLRAVEQQLTKEVNRVQGMLRQWR